MPSVLDRRLIVVTGKGGVGKTTLSAAIGLLAARRGRRTIVLELSGAGSDAGAAGRLAALLGHPEPPAHGHEVRLAQNLWGLSIDRDRVLAEWLRALGGRVPARVLTSSSTFQYLIAAAPGAREMISMVKVWELAQDRRPGARRQSGDEANSTGEASIASDADPASESRPSGAPSRGDYDLVVLDAPATGHALALLRSPQMFSAIARVGPIARQARQVRELLEDPALSAYLGVAHATEMATSETIELQENLQRELGRELDAVLVNGSLPRRFEQHELSQIAALDGGGQPPRSAKATRSRTVGAQANSNALLMHSAGRAAIAVHTRARAQQGQIARLRRRGANVITVPFSFQAELDLAAVQRIAERLERSL
jgi:anion-transporting  ArsA/GET3 family ATPase